LSLKEYRKKPKTQIQNHSAFENTNLNWTKCVLFGGKRKRAELPMDPCPCLVTDLELPELPNTGPLFIPALIFLHMGGGMGERPYNALFFIYWCMRKTQESCGLRGFVKRLETLSLALFSLVHLYPLVVSLFISPGLLLTTL
jgi:hypothetical protein